MDGQPDCNGSNIGGVIFLLNKLPLHYDADEEFTGVMQFSFFSLFFYTLQETIFSFARFKKVKSLLIW